jgi:hypothetical protein
VTTEERLLRLENAFATLVEVQRGLEERFDTHEKWINELGAAQTRLTDAQANSEAKIAALADAQIKTEEALARLAEAQAETEQRIIRLFDFLSEGES